MTRYGTGWRLHRTYCHRERLAPLCRMTSICRLLLGLAFINSNWCNDSEAHQQKLILSDPHGGGHRHSSVALSEDTAIVGAWTANDCRGAVHIFARGAGGIWKLRQKLVANNALQRVGFGRSGALSGNTAIIGVKREIYDRDINAGSAYIFVRNGNTWQQQRLIPSDGKVSGSFGVSTAISGDTAIIGSTEIAGVSQQTVYNWVSRYLNQHRVTALEKWPPTDRQANHSSPHLA
ncbi:MAG: FG-GAP repeat protein [Acidobacteria bacterium]|nr:FG-GAP repeat protein [Acidobacteriota bacterium]